MNSKRISTQPGTPLQKGNFGSAIRYRLSASDSDFPELAILADLTADEYEAVMWMRRYERLLMSDSCDCLSLSAVREKSFGRISDHHLIKRIKAYEELVAKAAPKLRQADIYRLAQLAKMDLPEKSIIDGAVFQSWFENPNIADDVITYLVQDESLTPIVNEKFRVADLLTTTTGCRELRERTGQWFFEVMAAGIPGKYALWKHSQWILDNRAMRQILPQLRAKGTLANLIRKEWTMPATPEPNVFVGFAFGPQMSGIDEEAWTEKTIQNCAVLPFHLIWGKDATASRTQLKTALKETTKVFSKFNTVISHAAGELMKTDRQEFPPDAKHYALTLFVKSF